MFALDKSKVTLPRTGCLFSAPLGTAFPTTFAVPGAPWKPWGYLGSDGPSMALSKSITEVPAWQEGDIVARFVESFDGTWSIPAVETQTHIIEESWNTVVDTATGRYVIDPRKTGEDLAWAFLSVDKLTGKRKLECWEGPVSEVGEMAKTGTDIAVLPLTLKINGEIVVLDEKLIAEATV